MSRERTAQLAKLTWVLLLIYIFANRFVGLAIGRAVADFLVFVLAVIAIPVSIYCLALKKRHGTRGILGHAVGALLMSALILAIWIPNFLSARERARASAEASASTTR